MQQDTVYNYANSTIADRKNTLKREIKIKCKFIRFEFANQTDSYRDQNSASSCPLAVLKLNPTAVQLVSQSQIPQDCKQ